MTPAIVFDLDGTLIDSAPDLHVALNLTLAEQGVAPMSLEQTKGFIGHGITNLVDQARQASDLPAAQQAEMVKAMFRHYLASPAVLTRPYPGAAEALMSLSAAGFALGLCTNKALVPTLEILATLGLRQYFGKVIGGDSLPQKKPDPAPLLAACEGIGRPALFVGDSEVDAATAAAAGLPFALFTKGYRKAPVADLPHALAFDDYSELSASVLGGRLALGL